MNEEDVFRSFESYRNDTPGAGNSTSDSSAISYITYVDDGLALSYALLAVVALVQLARIHVRLPNVAWTTQKVFQCLIVVTATIRSIVFACRSEVENAVGVSHPFLYSVLLDGPGLLFFSTFTLLILFWAEIYYQATVTSNLGGGRSRDDGGRSGAPDREAPQPPQKRVFFLANVAAYGAFLGIALRGDGGTQAGDEPAADPGDDTTVRATWEAAVLFAVLAVVTAYLFLLYGARLFMLLRRFPIDSRGRRSKLLEIGLITSIAFTCFAVRAVLLVERVVNPDGRFGGLDVMSHPVLNGVYYMVCEVLPMGLVMYILRKLPPKRSPEHGQAGEGRVRVASAGGRGDDVESAGTYDGADGNIEEPLLAEEAEEAEEADGEQEC